MSWLGVDVGGPRKGFDVALIDDEAVRVLARLDRDGVVALAEAQRPAVIGIDSPCSVAPPGARSRADERALAGTVCGIRWTPDRLDGPYYSWVVEGLRLYEALAAHTVIEVFPTASWTRWLDSPVTARQYSYRRTRGVRRDHCAQGLRRRTSASSGERWTRSTPAATSPSWTSCSTRSTPTTSRRTPIIPPGRTA